MRQEAANDKQLLSTADRVRQLEAQRRRIGSWGQLVAARLQPVLQHAGPQILDAGCSTGAYVRYLSEHGFSCHGLDILADTAWRECPPRPFLRGDVTALPFADASFDTVISFEVLEHLPDVDPALWQYRRLARKNIIVSVPNCDRPVALQEAGLAFHHWVDPTHRQAFTQATLVDRLQQNGFVVESVEFINPVSPELLVLLSWQLPRRVVYRMARLLSKIPWRTSYYMTLLAVAAVRE